MSIIENIKNPTLRTAAHAVGFVAVGPIVGFQENLETNGSETPRNLANRVRQGLLEQVAKATNPKRDSFKFKVEETPTGARVTTNKAIGALSAQRIA